MTKLISYPAGMSNGYFLIGSSGAIAVDTGCMEGEDFFLARCTEAGLKPEDIKLIVITHGHVDHFFNLPAIKKLTGAPVLCHKEAARFLEQGLLPEEDLTARTPIGAAILKKQAEEGAPCDKAPCAPVELTIDSDHDLHNYGVDAVLVCTPGHSRGCLSVVLDDGKAIVGDLFAAVAGTDEGGTPYFKYVGAPFEEALDSLDRLLSMGVSTFYSGHAGPFPRELVERCVAADRALGPQI